MPDSPSVRPAAAPRGDTALFVAQVAAVLAIVGGIVAGRPPQSPTAFFWAYVAQYLLAVALCVRTGRTERPGPARTVWWLLAAAITMTAVAVIVNGVFGPRSPLAGILLDVAAIAFYPLSVAALLQLGPRTERWRTRTTMDFAVVAVASLTIGAFFWISSAATLAPRTFASVVYGVALPISALLVLFSALDLVLRYDGRRPRRADVLVIAGIATCTIFDIVAVLGSNASPAIRLAWSLGTLAIGGAAWLRTRDLMRFGVRLAAPAPSRGAALAKDPERPSPLAYAAIGSVAVALLVEVLPSLTQAARVLLVGGLALGAVLVAREIAARRANRELARAREEEAERFRALVQRSSDALLIVGLDGTIRYHTPSLAAITGGPDVLPDSLQELVHADDREPMSALLGELGAVPGRTGTVGVRGADGRTLEVAAINRVDEPAIGGIVLAIRDTTERRRLELQLQQAQKMDGLGRLAGGLAHDFNNLLTAIIGYAELAQRQALRAGDDDLAMREIMRAGRQATELTGQLLAFSRRQPLAPRVVSLPDTVRDMERMLGRLLREDIELHVSEGADVPLVLADPTQLQQVVLNLAVNARDAMPHGGVLVIATGQLEADDDYRRAHPGAAAGTHALLEVTDTGVGMTPDVLARAFEPFFTTKPEGAGTGLGLATVYGIVTQAGGHLSVDSVPGRGTSIRVALPAVGANVLRRAELPAAPMTAEREDDGFAGATVLLVEDNDSVRELAARALREQGFEVLVASSGAQALVSTALRREPIDLLVTDVLMPGIGGIELARAMRDRHPGLPVLFATAFSERNPMHAFADELPTALLEKPFTAKQLGALARRLLRDGRRAAVVNER